MAPLRSTLGRSLGRLLKVARSIDLAGTSIGGAADHTQLNSSYKGGIGDRQLPFEGSGGNTSGGLTPGNGYTYHVFTSPGNLVCTQSGVIEVFGVAGGGGSYTCSSSTVGAASGGGGGGIFYITSFLCETGTHPVVVGEGGVLVPNTAPSPADSYNGGDTTLTDVTRSITLTAKGGGWGGGFPAVGNPGGSGGGTGYGTPVKSATQPTQNGPTSGLGESEIASLTNYGNDSGSMDNNAPSGYGCGGGGGAGSAGGPGATTCKGGDGQPFPQFAAPLISPDVPGSPTWSSVVGPTGLYGGGGGSTGGSGSVLGEGGSGGGRDAVAFPTSALAGIKHTGGGGGGQKNPGGNAPVGSTGGDGILVVRYETT